MTMQSYTMRAETMHEVAEFWRATAIQQLTVVSPHEPNSPFRGDVQVTFSSDLTLSALLEILCQIDDAHIMIRTLNYSGFYDGEYQREECFRNGRYYI